MKFKFSIIVCIILLSCSKKEESKTNKEVHLSPEVARPYFDTTNTRIEKEIEKEVVAFQNKLNKESLTKPAIKFSIDTFKIELKNRKRQEFDYSTQGMNNAVLDMIDEYKKLNDFYFTELLNLLEKEDKQVLINSQRDWLKFSESEFKLIEIMQNLKYNSGGSIQSNFAIAIYYEIIKSRTEQLFWHYNSIIDRQENYTK